MARTLLPPITKSGAMSISGASTNARAPMCGCGKYEVGLVDVPVAIDEQVEIDDARPPLLRLDAPHRPLDLLAAAEQLPRVELQSQRRWRR